MALLLLTSTATPVPRAELLIWECNEYQSWPSIIRAYVNMPSHNFAPNNPASCTVSLWNPTDQVLSGHHLFAILDVHGNYFYAPSFSSFDYFTANFPVGLTKIIIIPRVHLAFRSWICIGTCMVCCSDKSRNDIVGQ